ncbi:MAG TPA: hypothetical protein VK561_18865, partial [Bradyrhizobium sp.]|nr:hypothetical protein [Bradyrhizobium sp.]
MDARVKPGHDECRHLDSKHTFAIPPRNAPEALINLPLKEGVGNAGCPLAPSGLRLSRSAKPNHCAPFCRSQFLLNPHDERESASLTRVKHLQFGNAIV